LHLKRSAPDKSIAKHCVAKIPHAAERAGPSEASSARALVGFAQIVNETKIP